MIPHLNTYRAGQRVWLRTEGEYGTVLTNPGQVMAMRQEMLRVRMADGRELFFLPSQVEPAAVSGGCVRLATVNGVAV